MSAPSSPSQPNHPKTTSPKHHYTSLSSLIHPSPSSTSSPKKDEPPGSKPQRSGWHLPSVEVEGGASRSRSRSKSKNRDRGDGAGKKEKEKGRRLTTWQMMALTVSMGGGQVSLASLAQITAR